MKNMYKFVEVIVPKSIYDAFIILANQKILHERWEGRNRAQKITNFVMCWISEFAFKEILGSQQIKYAYSGLYVGPVELSSKSDFIVWDKNQQISLGIRSRTHEQLLKYEEVSYPDDRLKLEKEIINDFIFICSIEPLVNKDIIVRFFGVIAKNDFLQKYEFAQKMFSPVNQENFRLISLKSFSYDNMQDLFKKLNRY